VVFKPFLVATMPGSIASTSMCKGGVKLFQVVGRKAPTETEPAPPAYRMKLFAPNEVIAKSRFWYFLHQVGCPYSLLK